MNYAIFILYLAIFCWLLVKVPFIKKTGLGSRVLIVLFICKVVAGIAIGWLSLHYYKGGNDYWDVNREGWKEYQLLLSHPGEYFTNIFRSDYAHGYSGLFDSFQSFWNDLRNNIIIKLVSVFDFFSGGDYYVNSVFFNALVFFAHVALYRIFISVYSGQWIAVMAGCFLLPSTLYFSSGIHKDGFMFLVLAMLLYIVYFALKQNRLGLKRLVLAIICLVLLFLTRNFVCIALVPALLAWIVTVKLKWRVIPVFVTVYLLAALALFNMDKVFPSLHPLQVITQKQADYMGLPHSSTAITLDTLRPGFSSFAHNLPQAIGHVLLRPYLTEIPSPFLLPLNIELAIYQILFLGSLFYRRRGHLTGKDPFIIFAVFFSFSLLLFIGYIVPNLGSLVRYRSLYLPLLITPVLCLINWERIGKILKIIK